MLIFLKIITLVLAITSIAKTLYDYKRKQENFFTFIFWTLSWLAIVYVVLWPDRIFMAYLEMSRANEIGMGTFIGAFFVFLFFVTYRIYIKANRLERQIREIVMKLGIKDIEEK